VNTRKEWTKEYALKQLRLCRQCLQQVEKKLDSVEAVLQELESAKAATKEAHRATRNRVLPKRYQARVKIILDKVDALIQDIREYGRPDFKVQRLKAEEKTRGKGHQLYQMMKP